MTQLKEGDKAPFFKGIDQNGKEISLKELAGKKVILYFYPKDDTPGCTAEACNLRDNYDALLKKGFKIVGVSKDGIESHKKFMDKYSLPFPLIADTEKIILNDYGAWGEKTFLGKKTIGTLRTTFVISEKGIIEKVFTKVDTKNHTQQILDAM
jgi:thioredoxin-dependent peroxiredoxin